MREPTVFHSGVIVDSICTDLHFVDVRLELVAGLVQKDRSQEADFVRDAVA